MRVSEVPKATAASEGTSGVVAAGFRTRIWRQGEPRGEGVEGAGPRGAGSWTSIVRAQSRRRRSIRNGGIDLDTHLVLAEAGTEA